MLLVLNYYEINDVWLDEFTYDDRDNTLSEITQSWNGQEWMDKWKSEYTYDTQDYIVTETDQDWNGTNWVNTDKYSYTYNAQHRPLTDLHQSWDVTDWKNETQSIITYDAHNNTVAEIDQDWIEEKWLTTRTNTYTYNSDNYIISNSDKDWNLDEITVLWGDSTHYYYSELPNLLLDNKNEFISIFPNPSNGKISIIADIDINSAKIYCLTGEIVYSKLNINADKVKLNLPTTVKGIFILQLELLGKTVFKKIRIQ